MSCVLSIAGSDSGGGAGIQADLKTFQAYGCFGMTAITCLTAQNRKGVHGILPIPESFISAQLEAVFEDFPIQAVKIGMLYNAPIMRCVARMLDIYAPPHVILDPVMVAQSGDPLIDREAVETLITTLFPLATLITPNLDEASALLHQTITSRDQMQWAAQKLLKLGPKAVLLKGGHLENDRGSDCLILADHSPIWLTKETVDTPPLHGTGCTYSSAIAAGLATGYSLYEAIKRAKEFLHQKITEKELWQPL